MKLGGTIVFGGAFAAAAISFGAGAMMFSPLIYRLGWAFPVVLFTAPVVWLVFVVIAFRRYRWLAAWTLLGAPFALVSPLGFLLLEWACDWGRGPCISVDLQSTRQRTYRTSQLGGKGAFIAFRHIAGARRIEDGTACSKAATASNFDLSTRIGTRANAP